MPATGPELSLRRARELLGIAADASAAQIARAYRGQARLHHPDVSVEPDATERFWALHAAYRVALDAVPSDVPRTPAQAGYHVPTVAVGAPAGGVSATAWPARRGVAWLAAGPVEVRPPRRRDQGSAVVSAPVSSEDGP